jgi:glycosyltransferase involved in cell wall biosynthesis
VARKVMYVVVPAYNEERLIAGCLRSLRDQVRPPDVVVVVDNASTDGTAAVVRAFAAENPQLPVTLLTETEKGTGSAADTGFRHSIAHGADIVARTDADVLADPKWLSELAAPFSKGMLLVGGRIRARMDDEYASRRLSLLLDACDPVFHAAIALEQPDRKHPLHRRWIMSGNNFAIDAALYTQCGGFTRTTLEEGNEDTALQRAVNLAVGRQRTTYTRKAVVYASLRRVRTYGFLNTLQWYAGRKYKPTNVDVR